VVSLGRFGLMLALLAPASARAEQPAPPPPAPTAEFCHSSLEKLSNGVCYFEGGAVKGPGDTTRRTLVIFLHGLTEEGQGHEHVMQRGMVLYAKKHGFSLLVPRGRNGVGPDRKASVIAWPLGTEVREAHEDEVLAEWAAARAEVEARRGAFDEVFVMGFSNGAYFASSLALRDKLPVNGYAVFAGGSKSSAAGLSRAPKGAKPIFVGVASKDGTTRDKAKELVAALRRLEWPHKSESKKVGHVVGDDHIDAALRYLRAKARGEASERPASKRKAPKGKRAAKSR
jgi:predicted esterase